jgi:endonuclease/exonuclease/phosphatase family metal-dependent hydrolase
MKLSVISFNIRYCDDPEGNTIAERAPRLGSITKQYNPDILCFQECSPRWVPFLEELYGLDYHITINYRSKEDPEGCPILWRKNRFEALNKGLFWLSETPDEESRGWDSLFNCYRICAYAILRETHTGKTFTVMNTHFGFGDAGQVRSAELIRQRSQSISPYPTFITGDFNMCPHSPGYDAMCSYFTDTNTAGDSGTTFHGYHPESCQPEHIDYCFADSRVLPLCHEILRDTVDDKYPSDHFGLFLTLEL